MATFDHIPSRQTDISKRSSGARLLGVVNLSAKQLRHRFLESLLILLGIAVGVGVLTGMETFLRYLIVLEEEALQHETLLRSVVVEPRTFDRAQLFGLDGLPAIRLVGESADPVTLTVDDLLAARLDVPGVAFATAGQGGMTTDSIVAVDGAPLESPPLEGASGPRSPFLVLTRITPDEFPFQGREIIAGRHMTWAEFEDGSPVLVIEEQSVHTLFPGQSAEDVVGRTVATTRYTPASGLQGDEWRIIGVVADRRQSTFDLRWAGGDGAVIGYAAHTAGAEGPVALRQLAFAPEHESDIEGLVNDLEVYFSQRLGADMVSVTNPLTTLRQLATERRNVTLTLMGLAGLALLVAAVNILNLFTARVIRRRRLLATSIALGAERHLLFGRMTTEALLLGIGGSMIGLFLAQGIVAVLRGVLMADAGGVMLPALTLTIPDALFGLAVGVTASLLFGLYPATLSASIDPADGLRAE